MSIFDLFDFAKGIIEKTGYFGVFLGTFLESVFPPIPSEVIMGFAGFLISEGKFQWLPTILAAVAGNALSVSLIWYLGHRFGRDFLIKWGKWIGVEEKEIQLGENLFQKHGYKIVLLCQLVPLARTLIAFPAGVLKTSYTKFIIFNTIGASIWLTFLCFIGYKFGENWADIQIYFKPFERVIVVLILVLVIYSIYKLLKNKNKIK